MNKLKELWAEPSSRKVIILFGVLVVIFIAVLSLQQNKMEQQMELKIQFIEQKNMLRDELDDLIDEHDDLLDEYGELNEHLHEKDSIIQHQIAEIRNLIRTKSDLKEAQQKIAALKDISKRYLANIDSLLVLNETLTIEKDSVIKENKNINWKNYKLNKQNEKLAEKVNKGSVLELLSIDVEAVRYRSTGREVTTMFAKKVQKIRVCFSVGANQISDAETKEVYLQIINERGVLISGLEEMNVEVNDSTFGCTSLAEFDYNNIEMENCFEWERIAQFEKGTYLLNLIIEGRVLGQTELKLR
jgi:uncharacterized membrane-anchored protein YhcB (DUF1043 family)